MRTRIVTLAVAAAALIVPVSSYAQSTRRPDLNLFGPGYRGPQQTLGVVGNLGATFYDMLNRNVVLDPNGNVVPDHGWGTFGSGGIQYNLHLANTTIDGSLGAIATYYPNQVDKFQARAAPAGGAAASWKWDLTEKTHLSVGTGLHLGPVGLGAITPGGFGVTGGSDSSNPGSAFLPPTAAFVEGTSMVFSNTASLTRDISRRASLSGDYQYHRDWAFNVESPLYALWFQSAGARLNFAVTRDLSVYGGFHLEETHYADPQEPTRAQSLDAGFNYGKGVELQLTRRTTLNLNGGVSGTVDRFGHQHYFGTGHASLDHVMGRTWSTALTYDRRLETAQLLFQEPMLTDTVRATLNGLISRRLGFHAAAVWEQGQVGFTGVDNGTQRSSASTGLQMALGRHLALGADYTYYRADFESQVSLPAGLPAENAGHGIQVYLSAWAPLIHQRGRPNATR